MLGKRIVSAAVDQRHDTGDNIPRTFHAPHPPPAVPDLRTRARPPSDQQQPHHSPAIEALLSIIPTADTERMSSEHWASLYESEDCNVAIDNGVLGVYQPHISRLQRFHIVTWMSEACSVLGWADESFSVAVNAFDLYVTTVSHEILPGDLGPLATGCLYVGAQLIESATDENVYTLEKFRTLCPEVGQGTAVREAQAHLLDSLQGASLSRKTPRDFVLLYLAEFATCEDETIVQLYRRFVLSGNILPTIFDLCTVLGLALYTSGLCLDMPGSRLVACGILRGLELSFAMSGGVLHESVQAVVCEKVFHLPGGMTELAPFLSLTARLINTAAQLVCCRNCPAVINASDGLVSSATLDFACHAQPNNPTTASEWRKHSHPQNFAEWPIGGCTPQIVELGHKLQALGQRRTDA